MRIVFIVLTIFIFSGCSFLGNKKTEIVSPKNQEPVISEDNNHDKEATEEVSKKVDEAVTEEKSGEESAKKEVAFSKEPSQKDSLGIKNKLVSWGYATSSGRNIDTIVIHSSYNSLGGDEHSLSKILSIYQSYGVAPHYIIDREGTVYRLVEDKNIAYHAGVSEVPDGRENVNKFSLGIEIINTKLESPNSAQYEALKNLLNYLKNKYSIKYVLGHSDIAPGRKDDPWHFDWSKIK